MHKQLYLNQKIKMRSVYLIKADNGLYKIGTTNDAYKRYNSLKSISPIGLSLVCVIFAESSLERELHVRFANKKHHGEWFLLNSDDVKYITKLRNTYSIS